MTRVIVCGGPDYQNVRRLTAVLDAAIARLGLAFLITSSQVGAAYLAQDWARSRGIPAERVKAHWGKYGKAAGHLCHAQMLAEGKPDFVIAFPGDHSTSNMVKQAEAAGIPIHKIDWPDEPDQFPNEPDATGQMELRL